MVDSSKLKPGDRVSIFSPHHNSTPYIHESQSASGNREKISHGDIFVVADPVVDVNRSDHVRLETPLGKGGIVICFVENLDYVSPDYCVNAVHDMRTAGPPVPTSCSCDIMELMRLGCRCGYLASQRSASS